MARRVRLTRYAPTVQSFNNYGAYRMRIEVTSVEGSDLDNYLFIYRKVAPSPYTTLSCDVFEAVCGPSQLATYPVVEANPDIGWPFYRLNYVELDFQSIAQADSVWDEIQEQIKTLVSSMDKLATLQAVEDTWIPSTPTSSESSESGS